MGSLAVVVAVVGVSAVVDGVVGVCVVGNVDEELLDTDEGVADVVGVLETDTAVVVVLD